MSTKKQYETSNTYDDRERAETIDCIDCDVCSKEWITKFEEYLGIAIITIYAF